VVDELGRLDVLLVTVCLEEGALNLGVEDHAPRSRDDQLIVPAVLDRLLELDLLRIERELHLDL
jgi:hypothetical protein